MTTYINELEAELEQHLSGNGHHAPDVAPPADDDDDKDINNKPTDDEIGDMIIEDWQGNTRFFFGKWHHYADGFWSPVNRLDQEIWEKLKTLKRFGIRPNYNKVNGIEKYLQSYLWVDDESVDQDNEYINLQNGLFNLETGKLEPHKRDFFNTSQLAFEYDENANCPTFDRFLRSALITPDGKHDFELRALILEAIGYSLTSNTDYRVSFWLHGESGTGKSVLINTLQELAGNSHTTIDLDQMSNNPYQIADIAGKRVVTFSEPKANTVLADNHYKRMVSQDAIMARQIFGKPFRFVPMCKVWGSMNELPRVVDRSDAIFNRVIIIPMNHVIPDEKKDRHLTEKLRGELSGIFNLALLGLNRLRKNKAFTRAKQSENARADYKSENDIESAFITECCIKGNEHQVAAQKLYDSYAMWCKRNGAMAKSSVKVARDWQRLGLSKEHTRNGNFYLGVKLSDYGSTFV